MNVSPISKASFRFIGMIGSLIIALWLQGNALFLDKAYAETAMIEIQSEIGFGASNVKQGVWTPVKITLHNKGTDLSGDLVIKVANPNGNKDFSYAQQVELPKGSTKVVTLLIPGFSYTSSNNSIAFYEKTVKSGKKIPLDGKTYLEAFQFPKETLQVGVLARDVDTMNFLSLLNQAGKKLNLIHLKQQEIPQEALGLDSFDVLVFNDFASDTLSKEQVQATKQWVKRGGTLILAGGAGYSKTAAPFAEMAPVAYQGTESVQALSEVAKMGEKELQLTQPFTLSKASLTKGSVAIVSENTLPIYARSAYGAGYVAYAAYDLSLNPMASWNGNSRLWEQLLAEPIEKANAYDLNQMRNGNNGYWEMNQALEYFPSLLPPKLGGLAIVLLIYAIVVGPLLYLILRRLDRREWAWYIIPLVAIVTSVGIFQFSASNRGNKMAQTFNTIALNGSGSGMKQSMTSVFLPKGGNIELRFPEKGTVSPFFQSDVYPNLQLHDSNEFIIRQEQEETIVGLQDIPYSSVSKFVFNREQPIELGKLDYHLTELSANGAKGEITNNTKKDLTDVALLINQSYVNLGPVKAGASSSFDTAIGNRNSNGMNYGQLAFPFPTTNSNLDYSLQQRAILNTFIQRKSKISGGFMPMIVGWYKEQSSLSLTSNSTVPTEEITLVAQEMKLDYVTPDGRIVIPSTAILPDFVDNHLKMSAIQIQEGPFMQMASGDITLVYRLPPLPGAAYHKLEITGDPNPEVTLDLWNAQTGAWEPFPLKSYQTWEGDKLQPYILEGKTIRMRAATVQNNTMFRIPAVSLEGTVK
ncbi:hypothetical protein HQN90_04710 [Paenibacillus alba]|uniref:DUF7408 domain-containing protein n=1 Tax=Paenibacillus alba TaxID=1197127 RepID=UPI0015650D2F|nr:hypothetical protein [Paenibacillus alba]NQX65424.1 hypothetical protein [Paenibacillus alba]